jgi:hypothetical protein
MEKDIETKQSNESISKESKPTTKEITTTRFVTG